MRIYIIHLLMVCSCVVYSANPTGRWTFDDPENMLKATIGTDLEQIGSVTATYTTGPTATNKAIQVPKGTYFKSTHGIITPNGGGNYINEYSIMFDVRIPITTSGWMALFNANAYNGNNAECYISPEGTIGLGATGGYSDFRMQRNDWYRVIITVDLGSSHRYYIDGQLVKEGTAQSIDGSFSLDPVMSFFSDKGGDDDPIDVAEISIWGNILTPEEITILGGYEHNTPEPTTLIVNPYLQSPSQNSVIISWHGSATDTHTLRYGQSTTLDKTANNSAQIVEAGYIWHTANLTN